MVDVVVGVGVVVGVVVGHLRGVSESLGIKPTFIPRAHPNQNESSVSLSSVLLRHRPISLDLSK